MQFNIYLTILSYSKKLMEDMKKMAGKAKWMRMRYLASDNGVKTPRS